MDNHPTTTTIVENTTNKDYILIFGYKVDYYTVGYIIFFLIYYISFFFYEYDDSKIKYLWKELTTTTPYVPTKKVPQSGTAFARR